MAVGSIVINLEFAIQLNTKDSSNLDISGPIIIETPLSKFDHLS